jgi:hypothetical protein
MKIMQQYMNINPKIRSVIFIAGLIIIGIIIGQLIGYLSSPYLLEAIEGPKDHHFSPFALSEDQKQNIVNGYTRVSMILSCEIMLLIGLIYIFVQSYRKTRSSYLIGFILFVSVFFLKSVSYFLAITPLFREPIRAAPISIGPLLGGFFGPFGIYFTLFEIFAICILIYLSRE